MPNIPTFTAPYPNIRVDDRAETAYREAARQIGVLGREGTRELGEGIDKLGVGVAQAGQTLQQHQDFTDRMTGVRTLSALKQGDITELGNIVANTSPDDMPNALAGFNQKVDDRIGQWQSQFSGSSRQTQLWATDQASQYQTEQARRFQADSAVNAGNKMILDVGHTANSITGSLSVNPTSAEIDSGLKMWDQQTQALSMSPYITDPAMKARINKDMEAQRGQFIQTAIEKAITANPNAGPGLISRYGQYLSPEQQRALTTHGDQTTKANFWTDRAKQEDQIRQDKQAAERALTGLTESTYQIDPISHQPTGQQIIPNDYFSRLLEIGNMPGADHATLKAAATDAQEILNRAKNGVVASTDSKTYQDLFTKAYAGLTDQEVFQAHGRGQLSDHDATMFHQAVQDAARNPQMADNKKQFDSFINTYAKPFIVKSSLLQPDALEFQRLQQFENDKWSQFQAGLSKFPAHDLLDQNNPNFIGSNVTLYRVTQDQRTKFITEQATSGGKPVAPVNPTNQPVVDKEPQYQQPIAPVTTPPDQTGEGVAKFLRGGH